MCLTSPSELKITNKNIICFKYPTKVKGGKFYPLNQVSFFYEKNKITEKVNLKKYNSVVYEGYHSYKDYLDVSIFLSHLFIIPKGIEYYEGKFNFDKDIDNYVSSQIIWVGHILNPLTWFIYFTKYYNK